MQTFSASRFFACLKTTPPLENDSADKAHYCALRRNSVSPQDRFLEAWFSLFLRESVKVSRSLSFCGRVSRFRARLTRKNSRFPPSFARGACSFGKCARRILEVTASKISIFNAFIKLFNKRGLTRSPQRLRSAALRLYEQIFHFYTKDMFAYPFTIIVRRAMLCRCFL